MMKIDLGSINSKNRALWVLLASIVAALVISTILWSVVVKKPRYIPSSYKLDMRLYNAAIEEKAAANRAYDKAVVQAKLDLENLHNRIMGRVDSNFLDWYFGYFSSRWNKLIYGINKTKGYVVQSEDPDKLFKAGLEASFGIRVMSREQMDLEFESITTRFIKYFNDSLTKELNGAPRLPLISVEYVSNTSARDVTSAIIINGGENYLTNLQGFTPTISNINGWDGEARAKFRAHGINSLIKELWQIGSDPRTYDSMRSTMNRLSSVRWSASIPSMEKAANMLPHPALKAGGAVAVTVIGDAIEHSYSVEIERPLFRQRIESALRAYQANQLSPSGRLGSVLLSTRFRYCERPAKELFLIASSGS
ncbi:hypothetical protein [Methylobacterium bullatum]|uniref:Uncharacterized protein n=1 Tax=Methylobacterium bullatum TaxID=570505 RepID=A0A679JGH4_9HYPH|nr:hypothetical protein MBLL_01305 [Methylobacterium bullatum]